MKLSQLFSIYPEVYFGESSQEDIVGLSRDSREVKKGWVFVAVPGHSVDGHDFLQQAVENGATGLVVSERGKVPPNFKGAWVVVDDSRVALHRLASHFYGTPAEELFCVGITGTNGKTTTTYLIEHIFNHYGWKTGVMGTIDHHLGKHHWKTALTTPDAIDMQKRLREFVALGAKAAVFEVSSHALSQYRVDELPFDVAVFTNLSRDHLDYHLSMDEYFSSKQRLFSEVLGQSSKKERFAIVNLSDDYGKKIQVTDAANTISYGEREADLTFKIRSQDFKGTLFVAKTPKGEVQIHFPMPGQFNLFNALAAIGTGLAAGISLTSIAEALSQFRGVPGRLQRVATNAGPTVFVDYAHTPDALEKVLSELNEIRKNTHLENKIITVFGCGGDRDKGKRPMMGQVASRWSDVVFVTSDNPRTEDPEQIIQDILPGIENTFSRQCLFTEKDRFQAIRQALQTAHQDDVILIAGKGHETYQIIGTQTHDFDDTKVVSDILNGD